MCKLMKLLIMSIKKVFGLVNVGKNLVDDFERICRDACGRMLKKPLKQVEGRVLWGSRNLVMQELKLTNQVQSPLFVTQSKRLHAIRSRTLAKAQRSHVVCG